jgi:ferritin-like metal-binding protein YciE
MGGLIADGGNARGRAELGEECNPSKEPAMSTSNLDGLFYEGLKDIYYAERKILKALPKMARAADAEALKAAFKKHQEETQVHVERLQQVFDILGKRAQGKTCPAIDGILEEGEEMIDELKGAAALDAGLVAAAQAVEHYEIARYGTLRRWAETLGLKDAAKLLGTTLEEESATDEALSQLAESDANERAMAA